MRDFIGNPNKDEFYEEDDVESEVYYDGADNFIYLDPNEMGIEIDDDDDEVYVEDDEDFESFSLGDTSDDDEEYVEDEENLNEEGWLLCGKMVVLCSFCLQCKIWQLMLETIKRPTTTKPAWKQMKQTQITLNHHQTMVAPS